MVFTGSRYDNVKRTLITIECGFSNGLPSKFNANAVMLT